jgi:hypothetical protein
MSQASLLSSSAVKLTVRKGSIVAPLVLLLITIFMFVIYALPSEHAKLGAKLGVTNPNPTAKEVVSAAGKVFSSSAEAERSKLWAETGNSFFGFAKDVIRPLFKAYL